MILLGCLLAFGLSVAPRLFLVLAWLFSDRWDRVWAGESLVPLLGVLFLPYTTVMYVLAWRPELGAGGGIEGIGWMWLLLGLLLDVWHWQQTLANRRTAVETSRRYGSGASGSPAIARDEPFERVPGRMSAASAASTPPVGPPPVERPDDAEPPAERLGEAEPSAQRPDDERETPTRD